MEQQNYEVTGTSKTKGLKIYLAEAFRILFLSKHFIKKFYKFTNNTFDVRIKWLMQKVKNLFRVKDKPLHLACKIYKGVCSCG